MNNKKNKKKVLIFMLAYNAEKTIFDTIRRLPIDNNNKYDLEVLIVDDASIDRTFNVAKEYRKKLNLEKIKVLVEMLKLALCMLSSIILILLL